MAIAPNLLAQMLRANPFGAEAPPGFQTQQPFTVPGTRGEEADFLTVEAMAPLNNQQALLIEQLRQAQELGQPQQMRTLNPWAAGLSAIANVLRAGKSKSQQDDIRKQLAALGEQRQGLTDRAGRAPSRAGMEQARLEQQQGFQTERERLGREFQMGEADKQREFERVQLGRRLGAERQQAADKAALDAKKQIQSTEEGLRKEILGNPVVKAWQQSQVAMKGLEAAAKDPSPAGDLAIIFGSMQALDPGSVVRTEEGLQIQNATNLPSRALNYLERFQSGQRLTAEQRQDLINMAAGMVEARAGVVRQLAAGYDPIIQGAGASRANVFPLDLAAPTRPAPAQAQRAAPPQRQQPAPSDGGVVGARDSRNVVRTETDPVTGGTLYFYADGRVELEE